MLAVISDDWPISHTSDQIELLTTHLINMRDWSLSSKIFSRTGSKWEGDVVACNDVIGSDPYGLLAMIICKAWGDLIKLKGNYTWWSELHHRLILFVSVNCQHWRNGKLLTRENPLFWHTREAIANLLQDEVCKTHPEQAIELSRDLDRSFIRDVPLYFGHAVEKEGGRDREG